MENLERGKYPPRPRVRPCGRRLRAVQMRERPFVSRDSSDGGEARHERGDLWHLTIHVSDPEA